MPPSTRHSWQRRLTFLRSMLGLAFAILNSWTALAASLPLALESGGPSSVIWGLVTAGICNLCLAASLAEMLSAYPTGEASSRDLLLGYTKWTFCSWGTIPFCCNDCVEALCAFAFLDHGMDQRCRLDRSCCIGGSFGKPIDCGHNIIHAPRKYSQQKWVQAMCDTKYNIDLFT